MKSLIPEYQHIEPSTAILPGHRVQLVLMFPLKSKSVAENGLFH